MALAEEYMSNVKGDDEKLAEMKKDILKSRADAKLNQSSNYSALFRYARYGADAIKASTLTNEQVEALTNDELIACIKSLPKMKHRVMYYGPLSERALITELDKTHKVSDKMTDPAANKVYYPSLVTNENKVLLAHYDAKQIYYIQYSKRGNEVFSTANDAIVNMYNNYFGGGMNAIVFQEMREARGLAYSAWANYGESTRPEDGYAYYAFIATQNDKMKQAIEAFEDIINNMPQSQAAFDLAKQSALTVLATDRIIKDRVLWQYIDNEDMGVKTDRNAAMYEKIKALTLEDVIAFQQKKIKDRKYTFCILGDEKDIDMKYLNGIGKVTMLSQEEIFGY